MCALAGDVVAWTARGLELADCFPAAGYWRGTLLLNLGRWQWDRGEQREALVSFEAALEAREREPRNPFLREYARFGVGRALHALGQPAAALPHLERAVAWAQETGFAGPEARDFEAELAAARDDLGQARAPRQ